MAVLIRISQDNTDEKFFERYSALTQSQRNKINRDLEEIFPELFDNGHVVQIFAALCDDSFLKRMDLFGNEELDEHKKQVLVTLLRKLDNGLSKSIEDYTTEKEIGGINSNAGETRIQLLPRKKCTWEHRNRGASYSNNLLNYLYYFYFIDLDKTDGYEIRNVFLPYETFKAARKRSFLKIGLCPVSDQGELVWITEEREGVGYFSVTDVKNSDIIQSNLLELKTEFKRSQVDIAVMPEMLGNYEMLQVFREELACFPDDDLENPALTVFPSIWKSNHNEVVVLNELGDIVIRQEKQYGFLYSVDGEKKYLEDILPEKKISLIHCDGIGRIAILICKDALITKHIEMVLRELKVTLLIIPSFSTGSYNFGEMIQKCRTADCCVCWINSCSVVNMEGIDDEKIEEIGYFLRCGAKLQYENGTFVCKRSEHKCHSGDVRDCAHCVFTYRLGFG